MSDFIMDDKRGKTQYTIGNSKGDTVVFPSSSIVAIPPSERFSGNGSTLGSNQIFNITGASAAQTQTINTDGLYHIMVNMSGPNQYGQPKYVIIYVGTTSHHVGGAYFSGNSTHSFFIELKKGDLVKFGTPSTFYNYTMYPTYIQLSSWLIRRVAPLGGM
jgi:hypothetical protein